MIRLAVLSELLTGGRSGDPYVEPLWRIGGELTARGVALVRRDPDVILVDCPRVEEADPSCPLILFDKTDGGMLWWYSAPDGERARSWLRSPRVLGMIKFSRYVSPALYRTPCAEGAYHLQRIYEESLHRPPPFRLAPGPGLEDGDLARIELGFGFWAFPDCGPLVHGAFDPEAPRDIDVLCAATVAYASPAITHHRTRALEQVERLRNVRAVAVRGRLLARGEYAARMRRARICVSPWGWGETCLRDYEAMYAGCVLIKPRTDFSETWPPVDGRHYVPCAVDFSDLPERVDEVLSRWDEYAGRRVYNRARLLALRAPGALADLVGGLVRQLTDRLG